MLFSVFPTLHWPIYVVSVVLFYLMATSQVTAQTPGTPSTPAPAAAPSPRWQKVSGATSASIAITGQWHVQTSNALRWSDGRVALITYWTTQHGRTIRYLRCIDYMDANFNDTGNSCYQPIQ
jgi:hypothetical protein